MISPLDFSVTPRGKVPLADGEGHLVSLLTNTSKMPSKSWSLPAHQACPAQVVDTLTMPDGTIKLAICAHCYAAKGAYAWRSTANAQAMRFRWTVACMRTEEGRAEFIAYMVSHIRGLRSNYFRVHDSGDLFSPAYTRCWAEICRQLPGIRFWIPTRAWRFMDRPAWAPALQALGALENVTLRPSALYFGDVAPIIPGMAAGTTATTAGFSCPAPTQNNACGDCRVCWDSPAVPVSYHKH